MRRIGILSFQNTLNYGAVLQNYALFRVIEGLGFAPEVINYRSQYIERNEYLKFSFKPRAVVNYFLLKKKAALFNNFKRNIAFSPSCNRRSISQVTDSYDCVIVGSDQVWNTKITNSDPTFFLDFIDNPRRCKTFAASMGYGELPPCDFDQRKLISHFSSILVREKSAAKIISDECPDAPMPHVVLDPTLVLDKSIWDEIKVIPDFVVNKPFVLVYDVSESNLAFDAAHYLVKGSNVQIIRIQSYDFSNKPGVKSILNLSPTEFLGLFSCATATVVSSFHGLCFSIINHRDFYYSGQVTGKNTNSRAIDLMDALGISGRTVQDIFSGTVKPIDWNAVELRLSTMRTDSLRFFKDSLIDVEES